MAEPGFDEIIHAPNRLQICAMLTAVAEAEFRTLRDGLGVADSVMSKHLKVLADAGYVVLTKSMSPSGRARTWVSLTPAGRTAFQGHIAALQRLATVGAIPDAADASGPATTSRPVAVRRSRTAPPLASRWGNE